MTHFDFSSPGVSNGVFDLDEDIGAEDAAVVPAGGCDLEGTFPTLHHCLRPEGVEG
jgi:hypothetical protein